MKNISPYPDKLQQWRNPLFLSEPAELVQSASETLLREVASVIPASDRSSAMSPVPDIIRAAITAAHTFLADVAAAMYAVEPLLASRLRVSSSGLDVSNWLDRAGVAGGGFLPPLPVSSFLTFSDYRDVPVFGMGPSMPAVHLGVRRKGETGPGLFVVEFSVTSEHDMRCLAILLAALGDAWKDFERAHGVRATGALAMPQAVERKLERSRSSADYVAAYVEHFVDAKDADGGPEVLWLEFAVDEALPLQQVLTAACVVMWAQCVVAADGKMTADRIGETLKPMIQARTRVAELMWQARRGGVTHPPSGRPRPDSVRDY